MSEQREELADLMHQIWTRWTRYMIYKINEESDVPIWDTDCVSRWFRQTATLYADLSEKEKDSDRVFADQILKLLEEHENAKLLSRMLGE
jgi:hypothetical protein